MGEAAMPPLAPEESGLPSYPSSVKEGRFTVSSSGHETESAGF